MHSFYYVGQCVPILDDSCIFTSSLTHFSFESNRIASKFGGAKLMQIANFCDWRVLIWLSMHIMVQNGGYFIWETAIKTPNSPNLILSKISRYTILTRSIAVLAVKMQLVCLTHGVIDTNRF